MGDKHVPDIIGSQVHTTKGDGLGADVAKVWGMVQMSMGVKKQELGSGEAHVDALLKQAKWRKVGGREGKILLTLDGLILEVGGLERAMVSMPVLKQVHVVLVAVGRVPTPKWL